MPYRVYYYLGDSYTYYTLYLRIKIETNRLNIFTRKIKFLGRFQIHRDTDGIRRRCDSTEADGILDHTRRTCGPNG